MKKSFSILICTIIIFFSFGSFSYATEQPTINSPSAILIERSTNKVLYEKEADNKMYPASTTKIMTAILTLENCELTDVATVSYDAVMSVPVGYSSANLQMGEELTIDQLLHLLMIPSANDAANVLAEHIAGSVESFSTMMNTKSVELRMYKYQFCKSKWSS